MNETTEFNPLRINMLPADLIEDKARARDRGGQRDLWAAEVSWKNFQDVARHTLGSLAPYALLSRPESCHRVPSIEVPIEVPEHRTVYARFHGAGMTWAWGSYIESPRDWERPSDVSRWKFIDEDGDPVFFCDRGACFVAAELPDTNQEK